MPWCLAGPCRRWTLARRTCALGAAAMHAGCYSRWDIGTCPGIGLATLQVQLLHSCSWEAHAQQSRYLEYS
eukprot:7849570-Pyramimonas_sp.AAC.1